jgi:hypothetical protein
MLRQPLPIECRDTVTGHAFANGCVNEVTWYLEDKSVWAAALAMSLAMIHVRVLELPSSSIIKLFPAALSCLLTRIITKTLVSLSTRS